MLPYKFLYFYIYQVRGWGKLIQLNCHYNNLSYKMHTMMQLSQHGYNLIILLAMSVNPSRHDRICDGFCFLVNHGDQLRKFGESVN